MPKPKRNGNDITDKQNVKRPYPSPQPKKLRRSPRLEKKDKETQTARGLPPTPTSSVEQLQTRIEKRKSAGEEISLGESNQKEKRRKTRHTETITSSQRQKHKDRTTYWVLEGAELPPPGYLEEVPEMASRNSAKRLRSESRSESTTPLRRHERLNEHGVYMNEDRPMTTASRKLCDQLLLGDRPPAGFPVYKAEQRRDVLRDAMTASEAIIQRDVLPIVVPSVVNLDRLGVIKLEHFGEEINAQWTKVMTMGGKQPKPDYVAALRKTAFDKKTWVKLDNHSTTETTLCLNEESCFPLLIAEAKRGIIGIQDAEFQSTQAAAIAIKQQIHLLWAAYGKSHDSVRELYGQALVFTVCHDHDNVIISAHYAHLKDGTQDELEFFRRRIAHYSLTVYDGRDINKPNTFVENVYKILGPMHLKRVQEAAERLPDPATSTGMSFSTSQMELEDGDSQQSVDNVFKKPSLPPSARESVLIRQMMLENEATRKMMEEQMHGLKAQLEQAREESRKREEEHKAQLEQAREESRKREEEHKAQSEQAREQMDKLIDMLTKRS